MGRHRKSSCHLLPSQRETKKGRFASSLILNHWHMNSMDTKHSAWATKALADLVAKLVRLLNSGVKL
jgi:hypothetical protein